MKEKVSKRRSDKSPDELLAQHKAKVEHQVDRIMLWTGKLVKSIKSKKYQLTDAEKQKVQNTIASTFDETMMAFQPTQTAEEKKFKLGD